MSPSSPPLVEVVCIYDFLYVIAINRFANSIRYGYSIRVVSLSGELVMFTTLHSQCGPPQYNPEYYSPLSW